MHALCVEQCESKGVSPDEFGEWLDGPAIEQSIRAFMVAVADFSPLPKTREAAKGKAIVALDKVDVAMVEEIDKASMEIPSTPTTTNQTTTEPTLSDSVGS